MARDDDPRSFLAGTNYVVTGVLGRGSMGVVLDAVHEGLGSRVCVKVMLQEATAQPDLVDRFRLEAQALAKLGGGTHPGLVHVRDFGTTPAGRWFLVMERLEGRTFEEERRARGAVPWREAAKYVLDALAGLAVAHAAGVLHRDIKPANLFLCDAAPGLPRRAKVLDFGIAKIAELAAIASELPKLSNPTAAGTTVGTLRYISPEQLAAREVDVRTDVYAMGLVLWNLVTGHLPHEKASGEDLIRAQVRDDLPPASTFAPVPAALDALIARATAKAREARPSDAGAFHRELEAVLNAPEATAASVARPVPHDESTQPLPARFVPQMRTMRLESPPTLPMPEPPEFSTTRLARHDAAAEAASGLRRWGPAAVTIAATLLFTVLGAVALGWCAP
jgi:serine/threonine protein kinase